jgi:Holliday junction resolvase
MKESALTKKIRLKLTEKFGGVWVKVPGGPYLITGFPDLIGVVGGYMIAIEVKLPGKEKNLTERQALVLKTLTERGKCLAFMTTSAEDAIDRVGAYLKLKTVPTRD